MYQQHSPTYYRQEQIFNDKFPLAIVAILAIIQMLTTFGIIAFEIGHNIINLRLTNLFVGFWASIPFTILWISMFSLVCCCRRRGCATHASIQNFISFIFACILIGINIAFIQQPNKCFFTDGICKNFPWTDSLSVPFECYFDDQSNGCGNTRLALIKAQLAAGVIMAITCLIYFIIYNAVAIRASRTNRNQIPTAADAVMTPVYQNQPYTVPAHPYQPSAPVMMPTQPSAPVMMPTQPSAPVMMPTQPSAPQSQIAPGVNNANYLPPNQYPTIYPKIPDDRF